MNGISCVVFQVRKPPKPPQDQEAVTVSPTVAVEIQVMERDRAECQTGNAPEVEATVSRIFAENCRRFFFCFQLVCGPSSNSHL